MAAVVQDRTMLKEIFAKWSSIRTAFEFEKQNGPPKSLIETHGQISRDNIKLFRDRSWLNVAQQHQVVPMPLSHQAAM